MTTTSGAQPEPVVQDPAWLGDADHHQQRCGRLGLEAYEDGPNVLKVWTNGQQEDQYFLVDNHRKKNTDSSRPGQGLMIWHIDDSRTGNTNENRKLVDVESARGFDDPDSATGSDPLDAETDNGHSQVPFFSGNGHANYTGEFSATSNPHRKAIPTRGIDRSYAAL